MDESKASTTIKLSMTNYKYLCIAGKNNNRTISGQANWICRVVSMLEGDYPDIYVKITQKLSKYD